MLPFGRAQVEETHNISSSWLHQCLMTFAMAYLCIQPFSFYLNGKSLDPYCVKTPLVFVAVGSKECLVTIVEEAIAEYEVVKYFLVILYFFR